MDYPALLWNDPWMWMRSVYLPHIMWNKDMEIYRTVRRCSCHRRNIFTDDEILQPKNSTLTMFIFHIRKQFFYSTQTFQIYSAPSFSHHSQTTFHLPLKAHKNIFTKIKIGPPDQLLICNATKVEIKYASRILLVIATVTSLSCKYRL